MKHLILFSLSIVTLFLLTFGGYTIYTRIAKKNQYELTERDVAQKSKTLLTKKIELDATEIESRWIDEVGTSKAPYAYPATELKMHFDINKKPPKNTISLAITDLDEYKFFCVGQVLKARKIEATYYKSGKNLRLLIFLDDDSKIKTLLDDLRYYRINYQLQKEIS